MGARGRQAVLRRGDTVGVVAPGFAVPRAAFRAGLRSLRGMGFRVVLGRSVLEKHGYLAGDDARRADDLNRMLRDPDVRGIWFARGGYGTARLLDRIDRVALGARPRVLVGYSDLTALFAGAAAVDGQRCLFGPTVIELGDRAAFHRPSLRAALEGKPTTVRFGRRQVLAAGKVLGTLSGGTLTLLVHLLGTPHMPDLRGSVLFLEEVGEETYRIDRMLQHLRAAGVLERVRAVLLGSMRPAPRRAAFPPDRDLDEVLREFLLPLGVPVVTGIPAGHVAGKRTLVLGAPARLDTASGTLVMGAPAPSRGR